MRPFPAIAVLAGALGFAAPAAALNQAAIPKVLERAVDGFIRPGYRDLKTATAGLGNAMQALCVTPSDATLEAARNGFDAVVARWSHIEIVRVGPALEANRFERFLFYPDRKGTGLKQVQALLAKPDESATVAANLKGKSVAMQGLGALEFVLFGTGSETLVQDAAGFRCRYGAAVAGNLDVVAGELSAAWEQPDGVQSAWKHPGPDNPVYRDDGEAVAGLLGILVHGVEAVKDQRLRAFYPGPGERTRPKSAIYWRSANTFPSIAGNVEGIRDLWQAAGMAELLDEDARSLAGSIEFLERSIIRMARSIDSPVEQFVDTPDGQAKLDYLVLNTNDLLERLNRDYGGAVGLGAGFSFADGD
ncbi:hypothetical protein LXM94_12480 [Rhizobium sp. TRM95111]|nr:imelysin family protein [Rhizobium alarense]MCF3640784.1 hypothetical protein [Rhizobium alarense]